MAIADATDPVLLMDKQALLQRLREMLNFNVRTSLPEGADQPFQVRVCVFVCLCVRLCMCV